MTIDFYSNFIFTILVETLFKNLEKLFSLFFQNLLLNFQDILFRLENKIHLRL